MTKLCPDCNRWLHEPGYGAEPTDVECSGGTPCQIEALTRRVSKLEGQLQRLADDVSIRTGRCR